MSTPALSTDPDQLWIMIETALASVFNSFAHENSHATEDHPSISTAQYMQAHAAVVNYCTIVCRDTKKKNTTTFSAGTTGFHIMPIDLYRRFQEYLNSLFARIYAQLATTEGDVEILPRYIMLYNRLLPRIRILANIFSNFERHFLKKEEEEARAWHQRADPELANRFKVPDELKKGATSRPWLGPLLKADFELGAEEVAGSRAWIEAMQRAETTADPAKFIISIRGTGKRAWRIHFAEPLQERLCAALADEAHSVSQEDLEQLGISLKDVGFKKDHPIRVALAARCASDDKV